MGGVAFFTVKRTTGSVPNVATAAIVPGTLTGNPGIGFTLIDADSHRLKNGQQYTYFATATYNVLDEDGVTIFPSRATSRTSSR